jgi:hypothetical protein
VAGSGAGRTGQGPLGLPELPGHDHVASGDRAALGLPAGEESGHEVELFDTNYYASVDDDEGDLEDSDGKLLYQGILRNRGRRLR